MTADGAVDASDLHTADPQVDDLDLVELDRLRRGAPPAGPASALIKPALIGRPLLARGLVRRWRKWGDGEAEVLVRAGDQVSADQTIARLRRSPRAVALDAAGILGLSAERVEGSLLCHVGDLLAEGDVLADRRALGGLQRRVLRSPISGRLRHVSPRHGTLFIQPLPGERAVIAHLTGEVLSADPVGLLIQGHALTIAGVAGAGGATAGRLHLAESPGALPAEAGGGVVVCAFPLDEATAVALTQAGAVAIVAPGITDATVQRLGWDDILWPAARLARGGRRPAPPLTVVLLAAGVSSASAELWETLQPLAGELASAVGAEPGLGAELLVSLLPAPAPAASPPAAPIAALGATPGAPSLSESSLSPGTRVRVLAGQFEGLSGEVGTAGEWPFRLPSEVTAEVAEVQRADGVRVRIPLAHLQRIGE